jgi:hypothetical protein
MRRNARQRVAACVLTLLAQAGVFALFMQPRLPSQVHEDEPVRLTILQLVQPPPARPSLPARKPFSPATVAVVATQVERVEVMDDSDTPSDVAPPPDAAPGIDWHGLMKGAARSAAERDVQRDLHGEPGNSKPQVLVIPERPHQAGDTERYDDGAVLTWVNERCYWLRDPHQPGPSKICKTATLAERRAEANRIEREKAMKPGYLSRPLPLPRVRGANP